MVNVLSETRPGRVVDYILAAVLLFAITDYVDVIKITTTSIYVFFFITPLGYLRLYVNHRYKKQATGQKG
ncbi:hypothetical protein [Halobaculum sp. D14]|uniref:hypothetical protein n=1 Tax=Halobaculum sp. D14 TaxID=3421642 RepID=UPI003EBC5950